MQFNNNLNSLDNEYEDIKNDIDLLSNDITIVIKYYFAI